MSVTMADSTDNPTNYFSPVSWVVAPLQDPSDPTGASWILPGYYNGAFGPTISIISTDKFTLNAVQIGAAIPNCTPGTGITTATPPTPVTSTATKVVVGTAAAAAVAAGGLAAYASVEGITFLAALKSLRFWK